MDWKQCLSRCRCYSLRPPWTLLSYLPSGLATNGLHLICMGKAAPGLREPAQPEQGGTWDLHCPGDALKRVTDGCGGVNAPALSLPRLDNSESCVCTAF